MQASMIYNQLIHGSYKNSVLRYSDVAHNNPHNLEMETLYTYMSAGLYDIASINLWLIQKYCIPLFSTLYMSCNTKNYSWAIVFIKMLVPKILILVAIFFAIMSAHTLSNLGTQHQAQWHMKTLKTYMNVGLCENMNAGFYEICNGNYVLCSRESYRRRVSFHTPPPMYASLVWCSVAFGSMSFSMLCGMQYAIVHGVSVLSVVRFV